jgi:hypothetical protein
MVFSVGEGNKVPEKGAPVRIQFDISAEDWERALPFVESKKYRAIFGRQAFIEWVNRREARSSRGKSESDEKIRKLIRDALRKESRIIRDIVLEEMQALSGLSDQSE